jgi:hypothetical protein
MGELTGMRAQALMGSVHFCRLLELLRNAATAFGPGQRQPVLHEQQPAGAKILPQTLQIFMRGVIRCVLKAAHQVPTWRVACSQAAPVDRLCRCCKGKSMLGSSAACPPGSAADGAPAACQPPYPAAPPLSQLAR